MSLHISTIANNISTNPIHKSDNPYTKFNKRRGQYNKQLLKNNKHMRFLINNLRDKNKIYNDVDTSSESHDIEIEVEEMVSNNRKIMNLKKRLYLENNLHWDEEFY